MGHQLLEIDVLLHARAPHRVVRSVDFLEQLLDRRVERAVGVERVGARLEQLLVFVDRAEIFRAPLLVDEPVELEDGAVGLAGHALGEIPVDLLGNRVEAEVLVVDVQPAERFARRGLTQLLEKGEGEPFTQEAVVLPDVVEDDRRQADEGLSGREARDVDAQARLGGIPAALAARADADVPDLDVLPGQIGRVVGVQVRVGAQLREIARIHRQADFLNRVLVEELGHGLRQRRRGPDRGERQQCSGNHEGTDTHGSPHSENWKRIALLVKVAFEGRGPCEGSSSFSWTKFAWILIQRLTYQFTPKVVTWSAFPRMVSARGLVEPCSLDDPLWNLSFSMRAAISIAP